MQFVYRYLSLTFIILFAVITIQAQNNGFSDTDDFNPNNPLAIENNNRGTDNFFNAGSWYPGGTFPNLPAVTYFQASTWLGDTLYVHTPTTTGTGSTTFIKYTMNGTWNAGTPLPVALTGGSLTACNGKLYYIGGSAAVTTGGTGVYEYDPSTGVWATKAPLPIALSGHGAVAWGDSVIFVVGGPYTGSGTNQNVQFFRVAANIWGTLTASLPSAQGRRTFALGITGNKIIMAGGFNTAFLKTTWVGTIGADATQLTWAAAPDIPTTWAGLSRPGGTAIGDYFFVVNGERAGAGGYYDTTHVYQVSTNTWIDIINNIPFKMSNIFNAVSAKIFNDTIKIFIPGGYGSVTGATPGAGTNLFNVAECGELVIPVELISFYANAEGRNVLLNWQTASEKNNMGFEVQRKSAGDFETVGFVDGFGTTSETKNYSFTDSKVSTGHYIYRLKQIDFDGTFEYSNEIEADVAAPAAFLLDQNYPNPFNPSTVISFSLAVESKVTLRIFDILGQEITTLLNSTLPSGFNEINFNASSLNSGVYFYSIEATGTNGKNFSSTKKMILTK